MTIIKNINSNFRSNISIKKVFEQKKCTFGMYREHIIIKKITPGTPSCCRNVKNEMKMVFSEKSSA